MTSLGPFSSAMRDWEVHTYACIYMHICVEALGTACRRMQVGLGSSPLLRLLAPSNYTFNWRNTDSTVWKAAPDELVIATAVVGTRTKWSAAGACHAAAGLIMVQPDKLDRVALLRGLSRTYSTHPTFD